MLDLSPGDARRIASRAQLLSSSRPTTLLGTSRQLGAIQVDATSYVAPSAELVLWSRLGARFVPNDLARAVEAHELIELQGYLRPAEDIALFRAEMDAWPGRDAPGWKRQGAAFLEANRPCADEILQDLRSEGPLPARDLPDCCRIAWRSSGWNDARNVTLLLDQLEAAGEVAVAYREGRERFWDLAERVHPDVPPMPLEEALVERARRRLRALGIARARSAERRGEPDDVGDVGVEAHVTGIRGSWRVDPDLLPVDGFEGRTALLSPLDRLIVDRRRTSALFGFDYALEMYKPASERRWGYYALPVLHGDRLVGKVDAQADRRSGLLHVDAVHWDVEPTRAMRDGVHAELDDLARCFGLRLLPRPFYRRIVATQRWQSWP